MSVEESFMHLMTMLQNGEITQEEFDRKTSSGELVSERRLPIYGKEADWWDFWLEFAGMYRTQEENALGVQVFKWNKPISGRCDYPFALVYWRIGMSRFLEEHATFHGENESFGSPGIDSRPNHTAFMPKW